MIAALICVGTFFIWLYLLIEKFIYFGYYDWDLAMYSQAVWALSQGSFNSSLFGTNFLTNHAEYIAFFLAPFYKIFPSAFTLIVFKLLSFTAGAYVFYLIVKELLGWKMGLFFLVLYILHPANLFMLIYEFHFENLAIVFIFLMYYFFLKQRLIPFLICAFFSTIIKENISLVVFMFGLYAFFKKEPKGKGWIIGPGILGLGVFILTMFIITPLLRSTEGFASGNAYLYLYNNNPWQNFSSAINQRYILELFGPFHILTFLSPLTLSLGAPIFLQHFLAASHTMHTIYYHYAATAVIFIFLAVVETFKRLKPHVSSKIFLIIVLLLATTYALFVKTHLGEFSARIQLWEDRLDPVRHKMISQIPANASVVATFDFLDKLSPRKELYSLHNVWQDFAGFTGKSPYLLPPVSHALIDWDSPWLWGDLLSNPDPNLYLKRLRTFYFSHSWETQDAAEEITLLTQSKEKAQNPLVENSTNDFSLIPNPKKVIKVGEKIELLETRLIREDHSKNHILPIQFIWKVKTKPNAFLASMIRIMHNGKTIAERKHPIGYNFNATPTWEEGQSIKENYYLLMPKLPTGEYLINISVFDIQKRKYEDLILDGQTSNNFNVLKFLVTEEKQ